MPYTTLPVSSIPAQTRPNAGRTYDDAESKALVALMSQEGQSATDGIAHAEKKAAYNAAMSAKRLAAHNVPEGQRVIIRTWSETNAKGVATFRWATTLGAAVERKPRKGSKS